MKSKTGNLATEDTEITEKNREQMFLPFSVFSVSSVAKRF
jgi:hypothetical protein